MSFKFNLAIIITATALLGVGLFSQADAASVRKRVEFYATDRTLGGPGISDLNDGDVVEVFKIFGEDDRFLCVTAHNFGGGTASVRVLATPGGAFVSKQVINDETSSLCAQGQVVEVTCQDRNCEVAWRVDTGD